MVVAVLILVLAAMPGSGLFAPTSVGAAEIRWRAPVDAPVIDPFRPPSQRWGPGNRGLEYGLETEVDVRAVDAGRVRFAGRVAGSLFVTVDHGDGLWSTLAYLDSVAVVRGQRVRAGQILGTAGPGFHLTARLDGEYVDPALFLAGAVVGVRLVPGPEPPTVASPPGRSRPGRTRGGMLLR